MKYALVLLFLFITTISIAEDTLTGKVVKVADGDTITILIQDNTQVRVRLHGIDCPEKKQDFGTKAKQFTSDLCFSKTVKVEVTDVDRYGRSIGIVILPDGKILNKELLKAGLAWHYKYFDKSKELADLELVARNKKIGIWSMSNAIAPWEFRRNSK
ncbi:thermonuclease family protein [Rubrolithibacter danxiaensis]|uniref:thermonuclease family protein n=1 Tax=Rubrolithibacter danxiaensis TaxID=3390805 RepID=UPI003BF775DA